MTYLPDKLPSGAISRPQVWLCPLQESLPPESLYLHWLDDLELSRYRRFGNASAARRFLLGRLMLKSLVSNLLKERSPEDVRLCYSANQKPRFLDIDGLFFSISHTAKGVAVALAEADLGVDLELLDRRSQPWRRAQAFLHPVAAEYVLAAPEGERRQLFARVWTCQEAAVKLLDSSVFDKNARVLLQGDGSRGFCSKQELSFASWYVAGDNMEEISTLPYSGPLAAAKDASVLSVAAWRDLEQVEVHRWRPEAKMPVI